MSYPFSDPACAACVGECQADHYLHSGPDCRAFPGVFSESTARQQPGGYGHYWCHPPVGCGACPHGPAGRDGLPAGDPSWHCITSCLLCCHISRRICCRHRNSECVNSSAWRRQSCVESFERRPHGGDCDFGGQRSPRIVSGSVCPIQHGGWQQGHLWGPHSAAVHMWCGTEVRRASSCLWHPIPWPGGFRLSLSHWQTSQSSSCPCLQLSSDCLSFSPHCQ